MQSLRSLAERAASLQALIPGLLCAGVIAAIAEIAGRRIPAIGAPALAIIIGSTGSGFRLSSSRLGPGLRASARRVLQAAVVILGFGISLPHIVSTGVGSLPVLAGTMSAAWVMAKIVGSRLGTGVALTRFIGVGTAVCGASAIAAVQSVIDADEVEVGYALTTIFFFNVVAVLIYPPLGHLLGMSQHQFGLFAGTAINDTSSVVAATSAFGPNATAYGVVVKLTRTMAIIPICLYLAKRSIDSTRSAGAVRSRRFLKICPLFVLGFLAAASLRSMGAIPHLLLDHVAGIATWLISMALAAVGLTAEPDRIRAAGFRPLVLGGALWMTVGLVSLSVQAVGTALP